jgi:dTDP-4-dehydrorhamnose reductase
MMIKTFAMAFKNEKKKPALVLKTSSAGFSVMDRENISDTFGKLDKRKKIINVMRQNYRDNKITTIISKNLYLNLLNIDDLISAIKSILKKKIKSGSYLLKNKKNVNIHHLIQEFNKKLKKKIKIRWLSKKTIRYKIYDFKELKYWEPKHSNIQNIIELIKA